LNPAPRVAGGRCRVRSGSGESGSHRARLSRACVARSGEVRTTAHQTTVLLGRDQGP
jgi:hypothetical protein